MAITGESREGWSAPGVSEWEEERGVEAPPEVETSLVREELDPHRQFVDTLQGVPVVTGLPEEHVQGSDTPGSLPLHSPFTASPVRRRENRGRSYTLGTPGRPITA